MKRPKFSAGLALVLMAFSPLAIAQPASAFPANDSVFGFSYIVIATTHIARQNLTMKAPPGLFKGQIDLDTGALKGTINIPNTTFTQGAVPGLGLVNITATAAVEPVKPVLGHIDLDTFKVTSTSVFNIHILSMYASGIALPPIPVIGGLLPISLPVIPLPPKNLVGDHCITSSPVSVTMSGKANLGSPSIFKGSFTIPNFKTCQAMTNVINQQIPGPGNTFSALALPPKE